MPSGFNGWQIPFWQVTVDLYSETTPLPERDKTSFVVINKVEKELFYQIDFCIEMNHIPPIIRV